MVTPPRTGIPASRLRRGALALALSALAPAAGAADAAAAFAAVDPFIGTAGDGHTFPGAMVPFGMVQLSPDTQIRPRQAGLRLGGGLPLRGHDHPRLLPHALLGHRPLGPGRRAGDADRRRRCSWSRGDPDQPGSGYRSRFSHDERARRARLLRRHARGLRRARRADRRARVGVHRYTLPGRRAGARAARPAHQPLRLPGQGAVVASAAARRRHRHRVPRDARLGAGPPALLRHALLAPITATRCRTPTRAASSTGASRHRRPATRRTRAVEGRELVGVFDFAAAGQPLVVKVAISPVSEEGAIANLDAEVPGWDFDGVRQRRRAAWDRGARRGRRQGARADATKLLHRALPRAHGAEPVHGRRRALSRARQRRAPRQGLRQRTRPFRCGTPTARCIRC